MWPGIRLFGRAVYIDVSVEVILRSYKHQRKPILLCIFSFHLQGRKAPRSVERLQTSTQLVAVERFIRLLRQQLSQHLRIGIDSAELDVAHDLALVFNERS